MKQIRGIWLPDGDEHFQGHLEQNPEYAGKGTYQFKKVDAALRMVPKERRGAAVDIGAHVGLWTRVLSHEFESVIAVEPVPSHLECLRKNVADRSNVTIIEAAVGQEEKDLIEITIASKNSGNCAVVSEERDLSDTLYARMITLDSLNLKHLDLLKIDVEGYEPHVLQGGKATIEQFKPVVVVEQKHEAYGFGRFDAVDLLRSWGASVLWEKSGDVCMGWDE